MKLTKREAILLAVLSIMVLVFIEYQVLFIPLKAQYDNLVTEDKSIQTRVNETNKLISSVSLLRSKKDQTISKVNIVSEPFFGKLNADSLLLNTHTLLSSSGLQYKSYKLKDNKLYQFDNTQSSVSSYIYQLQKLADEYSNIGSTIDKPATPTPTPAAAANAGKADKSDEIETCSFTIDMTGSYEQLRQFITSLESLNKTIKVSTLDIKSSGVQGIIDATIDINFFGVAKFKDVTDQVNTWSQQAYTAGTGDPYMKEVVVTTTPSTTTVKR